MRQTGIILDPRQTGPEAKALEANLRALVVGQDEAIEQIVSVYQTYLTGLFGPERPIGSFLFLGPTGSGKTRMVEATSESLLRSPRALLKIDCAEFQHSHEIAKLIGSPPGYLGHRETHPVLSQEMLNQHHTGSMKISFVLFDEIEKASDALWSLPLGILDKGVLTLGDNRKVDFSKAMIFMTSNLGALEMNALTSPQFGCDPGGQAEAADGKLNESLAHSSIAAARRKFMPEFINRLDKIVTFKPLLSGQLMEILEIELRSVQQRIVNASPQRPFVVELTEAAKELLLREGTDRRYGARHLKRAIERLLVQPLRNLMATHQVRAGDCLRADWESSLDHLTFVKQADVLSCPANIEPAGRALPVRSRAAGKDILSDTVANEQLFRAG